MLITRMKFDTKAPVPKLFFKAMRWLSDEEFETTSEKGKSPEALKAITMTVSQQDGVAAAAPLPFAGTPPKAAKPKAAPAAKAKAAPAAKAKAAPAVKAKAAPAAAAKAAPAAKTKAAPAAKATTAPAAKPTRAPKKS
jgi:hypothetical protein